MRFLPFVFLFYLFYSRECAENKNPPPPPPKPKQEVLPYNDNWITRKEAMDHCIEPGPLGQSYHCINGITPHKYFDATNRDDLMHKCVNQDPRYDDTTFFCPYYLTD